VTSVVGVVERIAVLAVVATRGGGGLAAHLLLAVGLEVGWVHGERRAGVTRSRGGTFSLSWATLGSGSVQMAERGGPMGGGSGVGDGSLRV